MGSLAQSYYNGREAMTPDSHITEITRRAIFDFLSIFDEPWSGRLDDVEFLSRIYKLKELPSYDHRFSNAEGDIWQHRINNHDWSDDWYTSDSRLRLLDGPDNLFLRFLCETVHPVVRTDADKARELVVEYNAHLQHDGWELYEAKAISGRPVWAARLRSVVHPTRATRALVHVLQSSYLREQVARMDASVEKDPSLAIGTAKELIETVCKAILDDRGVLHNTNLELAPLVKLTSKTLGLVPEAISDGAKAAETIKVLLSNLASVAGRMAELRNQYGTGHGKHPRSQGLEPRHARLAVGASTTLVTFFYDTHLARRQEPAATPEAKGFRTIS